MNREEILRERIKDRYGSVLEFSKESGIPNTTIRNIFNRGLDGVGVGTVLKICKALELDIEELMDGRLSVRPNHQKNAAWSQYVQNSNLENSSECENERIYNPQEFLHLKRIPILGRIAAGNPIYAEENIEGYTFTDLNGGAEYFGLRVQGDSMDAAGIKDGYVAIVRRQDIVENGQIAVVLIDGEGATLKRFSQSGSIVTLMPQSTNPIHRPFIFDLRETNVDILGLVVKVEFSPS